MLEMPTQARPLFAPEMRHNPVETEAERPSSHRPPTEEHPLPEPAQGEAVDLQPAPLPEPAPVAEEKAQPQVGTPGEADPEGAIALPGAALAEAPVAPSQLDAMSLFQGMLAEATRSGVNVPGTSMHIYALVQQLSQLVQSELELAA